MEAFIKGLPKVELHLHIEGTLEPEMMFELAARNGVTLPFADVEAVRAAYEFTDLQGRARTETLPPGIRIVSSTSPITFRPNGTLDTEAVTVLEVEMRRGKFVIVDQSTNGTFLQNVQGKETFVRRDTAELGEEGTIGLGRAEKPGSSLAIYYKTID